MMGGRPDYGLRFHAATFRLVGVVPIRTEETKALVDGWEIQHGRRLPPSLREWFEIANSVEMLEEFSNDDRPVPLGELEHESVLLVESAEGGRRFRCIESRAPGDGRNESGCVVGTADEPGYYRILIENQGVVNWYVVDDGSDDPPVFVDWDSPDLDDWRIDHGRLSTFLYDFVDEYRHRRWPAGCGGVRVVARENPPEGDDLQRLHRIFDAGPSSPLEDHAVCHRFFDAECSVHIGFWREDDLDPVAGPHWEFLATTEDSLRDALRRVIDLGSLRRTLRPSPPGDEAASSVLHSLGVVEEPPRSAIDHFEHGEALSRQAILARRQDAGRFRSGLCEAIEAYERALELDPRMLCACQAKMCCHEHLGDMDSVLRECDRWLSVASEGRIHRQRAELRIARGMLDDAALDVLAMTKESGYADDLSRFVESFENADRNDLGRRIVAAWRAAEPRDQAVRDRLDAYLAAPTDVPHPWAARLEVEKREAQAAAELLLEARKRGVSSLWVGRADSDAALASYLGADDRGRGLPAPFDVAFGTDRTGPAVRTESRRLTRPTRSVAALLGGRSYAERIVPTCIEVVGAELGDDADAIVVIYGLAFQGVVASSRADGVSLRFLASIPFATIWADR